MDMLTTMITPYAADGSIDYAAAEKYVDWYYESGIDGIFAVCQSSEIFYLSLEERVRLNRTVYNRAKQLNKDFLVVTHLLQSMIHAPVPTRAEVTDIYNACLDGAACLMLTGETAQGEHGVEAVRILLEMAHRGEEDRA